MLSCLLNTHTKTSQPQVFLPRSGESGLWPPSLGEVMTEPGISAWALTLSLLPKGLTSDLHLFQGHTIYMLTLVHPWGSFCAIRSIVFFCLCGKPNLAWFRLGPACHWNLIPLLPPKDWTCSKSCFCRMLISNIPLIILWCALKTLAKCVEMAPLWSFPYLHTTILKLTVLNFQLK